MKRVIAILAAFLLSVMAVPSMATIILDGSVYYDGAFSNWDLNIRGDGTTTTNITEMRIYNASIAYVDHANYAGDYPQDPVGIWYWTGSMWMSSQDPERETKDVSWNTVSSTFTNQIFKPATSQDIIRIYPASGEVHIPANYYDYNTFWFIHNESDPGRGHMRISVLVTYSNEYDRLYLSFLSNGQAVDAAVGPVSGGIIRYYVVSDVPIPGGILLLGSGLLGLGVMGRQRKRT